MNENILRFLVLVIIIVIIILLVTRKPTPKNPSVPFTPITPITPFTPINPNDPSVPFSPITPVTPWAPFDPPFQPIDPVVPFSPVTPVTPWAPINPVVPFAPITPVTPWAPITPVTPWAPINPVVPFSPITPVTPWTPITPANPIPTPIGPIIPPPTNLCNSNSTGYDSLTKCENECTSKTCSCSIDPIRNLFYCKTKPVVPFSPITPVTPFSPITPVIPPPTNTCLSVPFQTLSDCKNKCLSSTCSCQADPLRNAFYCTQKPKVPIVPIELKPCPSGYNCNIIGDQCQDANKNVWYCDPGARSFSDGTKCNGPCWNTIPAPPKCPSGWGCNNIGASCHDGNQMLYCNPEPRTFSDGEKCGGPCWNPVAPSCNVGVHYPTLKQCQNECSGKECQCIANPSVNAFTCSKKPKLQSELNYPSYF